MDALCSFRAKEKKMKSSLVRSRHMSAEFSEVFDAAWNEFLRRYAMRLRAECERVPDSRLSSYVSRSKRLPF